jgi:ribosomal protein L31
MLSKKSVLISVTIVTAALTSSVAYSASDDNNPLHPSYFATKSSVESLVGSGSNAYVDTRNPLHPAYFGAGNSWAATGVTGSIQPYVDSNNPLHPAYKRS